MNEEDKETKRFDGRAGADENGADLPESEWEQQAGSEEKKRHWHVREPDLATPGDTREILLYLFLPRRLSDGRLHWLERAVQTDELLEKKYLVVSDGLGGQERVCKRKWRTIRVDPDCR